jgi:hypothetical protein
VAQDRRPDELLISDAELRQQSSSRVKAAHSRFSHRVVARRVRRKTQPKFAQDPKLPQLRQQAANSA